MTVLGPIDPAALGVTLQHESIVARSASSDVESMFEDPHRTLRALEEFYLAGGRSIVDRSTANAGRDVHAIAWIAARSPVNIVVSAGCQNPHHDTADFASRTVEKIAAEIVAELTDGIDETGVCAGIISVRTGTNAMTTVDERMLRASAWAQLETGAPIAICSDSGSMAFEQLAVLQAEGAETTHVIVGHMESTSSMTSILKVLEAGAFASFDLIAHEYESRVKQRAVMLTRLIESGYADQLLLSGGVVRRSMQPAYRGDSGWAYVVEEFPLALMEEGLGAREIRRMLVENAARALTTRPPSRHIPLALETQRQ